MSWKNWRTWFFCWCWSVHRMRDGEKKGAIAMASGSLCLQEVMDNSRSVALERLMKYDVLWRIPTKILNLMFCAQICIKPRVAAADWCSWNINLLIETLRKNKARRKITKWRRLWVENKWRVWSKGYDITDKKSWLKSQVNKKKNIILEVLYQTRTEFGFQTNQKKDRESNILNQQQ